MTDGQSGWHPPMPPDGPVSPTTPVRLLTGAEAPPLSVERFDAVGMQSVLTRARDRSRFVAPPREEEATKRALPVRGLAWGALLVAAIGIVAGMVYVSYFRPIVDDPDTIVVVPTATATREEVTAQTPQEIVTEYFEALSTGDVDRALAMGNPGGNGSHALLDVDVFARARELSPITDVQILSDDPTATEVPVRYLIGGQPFETAIVLDLLDNGRYRLAQTTVTAEFSLAGGQNLPMLVNGRRIDPKLTFEVLPGTYEVSTGLPFVDYAVTGHLQVASPSRADVQKANVTPELTEAGRSALVDAARASLQRCISANSIAPAGCPNQASAGGSQVSSATWRLTNNPWSDISPTLVADDQSVALMRLRLETSLHLTYGNGSSSNPTPTIPTEVRASMLGTDPAGVRVTWATG
ncbi:hypothetical protein GCM10025789_25790 [Tessaracoccus lubricantis]|uniref:GerMN domain-containing protein n=1 Tax=Tessaracoccus lubricantis TaxID=545543 RepID=A0ABP9FKN6_9ACTN